MTTLPPLPRPCIKICGLTREHDVALAHALGASFVGFVLVPDTPRCVTLDRLRQLTSAAAARDSELAPISVAVLRDPTLDQAAAAVDCGARALQLHGDESPDAVAQLRSSLDVPVFKAIGVRSATDIARMLGDTGADLEVLDARTAHTFGGAGRRFEWSWLDGRDLSRTLLAGGLTPDAVPDALRYDPFGLDVSSGVELTGRPGRKCPTRLRAFFDAVRRTAAPSAPLRQ